MKIPAVLLLLAAALCLSACLQNRVQEGEGRPVLSTLGSATVVFRVRGPGGITYVRVHPETGLTAGGGCFIYDHFEAGAPPEAPSRTFAFSVPAGVYAPLENGWGTMTPAFEVRRGDRVYLGDFYSRKVVGGRYPGDHRERTEMAMSVDQSFAAEHKLKLARTTPSQPAGRFLCVP
jgi:hypothetical protein